MSNHVASYDIRNLSGGPVARLARPGRTQQRITFDLDWAGRWLVTGGTDGIVRAYDVTQGVVNADGPAYEDQIAEDVVSSISLHPFRPWVLASVGSRRTRPERWKVLRQLDRNHSESNDDSDDDSDDDSSDDSDRESSSTTSAPTQDMLAATAAPSREVDPDLDAQCSEDAVDEGLSGGDAGSRSGPEAPAALQVGMSEGLAILDFAKC